MMSFAFILGLCCSHLWIRLGRGVQCDIPGSYLLEKYHLVRATSNSKFERQVLRDLIDTQINFLLRQEKGGL